MKAAVYTRYGPPEVVHIEDVEKPAPKNDEVLIKVRAASVNPLDSHLMKGKPYVGRLVFGLFKPKLTRPGVDVAGVVEAIGRSVTEFKPGDEVFGSCRGAFAEFACTSESKLAMKPANVTFAQAAGAPVAAYTALQGFRDKASLQPGQNVLINGAAGGVGTLAVQVARGYGAKATGVCSTRNVEMVRAVGADDVIDYTREDFTEGLRRYDVIFDLVANHSLLAVRRVLKPKGIYLGAGVLGIRGGMLLGLLVQGLSAAALSRSTSQKFMLFTARARNEDLIEVRDLMEAGKLTPVIDRTYPLSEVAEAIRHVAAGHARGKVVITLD
jgi:NADPH:quinone reductase-like Zn-dependent oxidoreductase